MRNYSRVNAICLSEELAYLASEIKEEVKEGTS
jgi:hypothetical protein